MVLDVTNRQSGTQDTFVDVRRIYLPSSRCTPPPSPLGTASARPNASFEEDLATLLDGCLSLVCANDSVNLRDDISMGAPHSERQPHRRYLHNGRCPGSLGKGGGPLLQGRKRRLLYIDISRPFYVD